jgi:hypothetical protein
MAKNFAQSEKKSPGKPSHEEIAKRAYEIFEQSGREPGRDMENWLAAETELSRGQKPQISGAVKPMAKAQYREQAERPNVRTSHA